MYVKSVTHKLSSSSRTSLKNSVRSERLCIDYVLNYFDLSKDRKMNAILDLPKFRKITIILDLPKVIFNLLKSRKMMSLRIFISPVVEGLRTSNLKSRFISLKGFHTALHHKVNVALLGDNHVILRNLHISSYGGASVIKFEQDVHGLNRRP